MLLSPEHIIHTSNNQHTPKHNHAPVHICDIRRVDDGEETRDTGHGYVEDGEDVYWHAEFAEGKARGGQGVGGAEAGLEDAVGRLAREGWKEAGEGGRDGRYLLGGAYQAIDKA